MIHLNNKEKALAGVGVLVVIFLGFGIWFMFTHQPARTAVPAVPAAATTTAPAAPVAVAENPQDLSDHAKYYDVDTSYPSHTALSQTAGAQADADAVATMKGFLQTQIDQFKQNNDFADLTQADIQMMGLDDRKYSLDGEYKSYQGPATASYVFSLSEDTGGAHPNPYYRTFTFDLHNGKSLALADIFMPGSDYLGTLSRAARADLPALIDARQADAADTDEINTGTAPTSSNYQSWYIDGNNLVILFGAYQVGPYSIGIIRDAIPLSKLTGILEPAYKAQ